MTAGKKKLLKKTLNNETRIVSHVKTKLNNHIQAYEFTKTLQERYSKIMQDMAGTCKLYHLKSLLTANNQTKSGNKADLLLKCTDGVINGQIPKCDKCGGGVPTFNIKNGKYYCRGYIDDDEFMICDTDFEFGEVKRLPWKDTLEL